MPYKFLSTNPGNEDLAHMMILINTLPGYLITDTVQ